MTLQESECYTFVDWEEDGPVLASLVPAKRSVELIPPMLVVMLNELGKLPPIPNEPDGSVFGFRKPTLADMSAVKWLAYWASPKTDEYGFRPLAGLATFRDVYDWHTSSEVRELLALRGNKRASVELTKWLVKDGMENGRRLVGAVKTTDFDLIRLMHRLGGAYTRTVMEYQCPNC